MSATRSHQATKALENLRTRLLDLSARNRLIHFRHTSRSSLRIIDELPDQLAASLLNDKEMRFQAVPEPTEKALKEAGYLYFDPEYEEWLLERDLPTAAEWAQTLGLATDYELPAPPEEASHVPRKHRDRAIQTLFYPHEMEARLKTLAKAAEDAIQEMGANILYLSFGFLEWFEEGNTRPRLAPLFLMPVRLRKGRLNAKQQIYEYLLSYSGEDLLPNLSLREKLRVDFSLILPDLDEHRLPEAYFRAVQAMLDAHKPEWRIRRYISLCLLNFSKLLMYLDLDPKRWPEQNRITQHPIIARFLGESAPDTAPDQTSLLEHPIDDWPDVHWHYPLINHADSSQHSALIDVLKGQDQVIEGPPGTGKSQTITNLIAAALAQGKTVLFVAEKLAALEVVHKRLQAAGLGDFCLELHSHKTQKRKIIQAIGQRLQRQGQYPKPASIEQEITHYEKLKTQLKAHVALINSPWKHTGKTPYQIFATAIHLRQQVNFDPSQWPLEGDYDGQHYDPEKQRRDREMLDVYRKLYHALPGQTGPNPIQAHPWYGVQNPGLQLADQTRAEALLTQWQKTLQALEDERLGLAEQLACPPDAIAQTLTELQHWARSLQALPTLERQSLWACLPQLQAAQLPTAHQYFTQYLRLQEQATELEKACGHGCLQTAAKRLEEWKNRILTLIKGVQDGLSWQRLIELHDQLDALNRGIQALQQPLAGLREALGSAGQLLSTTPEGLHEFQHLITLIARLDAHLWPLRHALFDNDALDDLLPQLATELQSLRAQRDELAVYFQLSHLPSATTLQQWQADLHAGGWLRWFKSRWWAARRHILGIASTTGASLGQLTPHLPELIAFAKRHQQLLDHPYYAKHLGPYWKGLDTDLESVQALRAWYKTIRQHYGLGFSEKATLGDAIFQLPDEAARAIRLLAEQDVPQQIEQQLAQFHHIRQQLPSLLPENQPLMGAENPLQQALQVLREHLASCPLEPAPIFQQPLPELLQYIEHLLHWQHERDAWQASSVPRQHFSGQIQLSLDTDNTEDEAQLRALLKLADFVAHSLPHAVLREYLYQHPSAQSAAQLRALGSQLGQRLERQNQAQHAFQQFVDLDLGAWLASCNDRLMGMLERNQHALEHASQLQGWVDYLRARQPVQEAGLKAFVEAVENGRLSIQALETAYQAVVHERLAREILRQEPHLAQFSGPAHEAVQNQFREYDNHLAQLQRQYIAWRLDQREIPPGQRGSRVGQYTDLVLLEHESHKKTRHIPIRQLLKRAGKALQAIKPCFMMSPMSVAQYLAPGALEFDLIVMDEASQIRPQDALGAIARGRQLVVVGDPKQLPPTQFFDRLTETQDDEIAAIEESESILDATLPLFQARRLRWHYRSQHEDLIAFSNQAFYENHLIVFPSPHAQNPGYGLHYTYLPQGCFVNRHNFEEARIIAALTREHFRHAPQESLGIVAMSAEQRLQIERAIDTLARDDAQFRQQLEHNAQTAEPLFVKNLENVQGDERDVIFISMTYGPRKPGGKVYQRFGPINSNMGWRRLNVLFTRSRKRMHIFSSMHAEDIRIQPSSTQGVRALHDFLAFCENPTQNQPSSHQASGHDALLQALRHILENAGFSCRSQVGIAGFFIDLAVIDPAQPKRYLLGIECDGPNYQAAATVRDRDHIRHEVLQRLGWNLYRVWASDWFKDPESETTRLLEHLEQLRQQAPEAANAAHAYARAFEQVIAHFGQQSAQTEALNVVEDGADLKGRLLKFEQTVIRPQHPHVPKEARLLRNAMLEALLRHRPIDEEEFLERIPAYLRESTAQEEWPYLDAVLAIINDAQEDAHE